MAAELRQQVVGQVFRAADRTAIGSGWSNAEIEALSPMKPNQRLEPVLITLAPGGRSGKHPYPHPREEFAFVLEGEVQLILGPERHALVAGDAAMILPKELRLWENSSALPARVLVVSLRGRMAAAAPPEGKRP